MNGLLLCFVLLACLVAGAESRAPGVVNDLVVCAGTIDRALGEGLVTRLVVAP